MPDKLDKTVQLNKALKLPNKGLVKLKNEIDTTKYNVLVQDKKEGKTYLIDSSQLGNDGSGGGGASYVLPYLKTGGASWSGTGLVYDVTALEYYFNGDKTTNATQVTLDASDPIDNRLDAIVVDEAGVVSVIKGDASASPISPSVDESHILVQYILVEAGTTEPTIVKEDIYLENAEWTTSTYTTGTATGSIDFDNAVSPKQGVKCISANTDARLGARFVRATSFDPYQYTMLSMWVRFTGSNVATNKSLNVRFENGAGALVANTINLFNFGLQRNLLNVWQLVVIPITSFGTLPTSVKGLKIIMAGGTVGQARQWDVDYMILTNGSVPQANVPTIVFAKDGTNIASQSGINLIEGTGVTISGVNNPTNNRVDYTINASVGGTPAGSDTQIQYNNAGAFGADSGFTRDVATGNANLAKDVIQQSAVTFTGSGLDDLTLSGTFSGTVPTTYTVTVASTGTPDTFDWTDGTNSGTGVSMSTSPILLSNGISITFGADTGHTLSDSWTWTYTKPEKFAFKLTDDFGGNLGSGLAGVLQKYENTAGGINREARLGITELPGEDFGEFFPTIEQSVTDNATYSAYRVIVDGISDGYRDLSTNDDSLYTLRANNFSIINTTFSTGSKNGISVINELGITATRIGNLFGGNGTKITIDDVNEQITISNLPAYDDDAAAGTAGLTAGMVYMTTGSGAAPLNAAGILMIKQ